MSIINLTADNFEQEAVKSEKKVLIDFWAAWCGPCRMIAPSVEEIAEEYPDIKVCKVNVDEQAGTCETVSGYEYPDADRNEGRRSRTEIHRSAAEGLHR